MVAVLGGLILVALGIFIFMSLVIGAVLIVFFSIQIIIPLLALVFPLLILAILILDGESYSPIHTLKKAKWRNRSGYKPQLRNNGWFLAVISGLASTLSIVTLVVIVVLGWNSSGNISTIVVVAFVSPLSFSIGKTLDGKAIWNYAKQGGDISMIKSSMLKYDVIWNTEIKPPGVGETIVTYILCLISWNMYPLYYITLRSLILGVGKAQSKENRLETQFD